MSASPPVPDPSPRSEPVPPFWSRVRGNSAGRFWRKLRDWLLVDIVFAGVTIGVSLRGADSRTAFEQVSTSILILVGGFVVLSIAALYVVWADALEQTDADTQELLRAEREARVSAEGGRFALQHHLQEREAGHRLELAEQMRLTIAAEASGGALRPPRPAIEIGGVMWAPPPSPEHDKSNVPLCPVCYRQGIARVMKVFTAGLRGSQTYSLNCSDIVHKEAPERVGILKSALDERRASPLIRNLGVGEIERSQSDGS